MNETILPKFKEYVHNNYHKCGMTSGVICAAIGCSTSLLNTIINIEYGYPPKEYIDNFKMLKAMDLISGREKDIYCKVGYRSYAVFYKAFLRVTGLHVESFYDDGFRSYKRIIPKVQYLAEVDPYVAVQFIVNHKVIGNILLKKETKQFSKIKMLK